MRTLTLTVVGVVLLLVVALCGLVGAAAMFPSGDAPEASAAAGGGAISDGLEAVYRDAAVRYCGGLPSEVLAAVGWVESRHGGGHVDPVSGDMDREILGPPLDGTHGRIRMTDPTSADGWAHAEGPMQFLPSTWRYWATLAPARPAGTVASPHNLWDAVHTAARMLCGGQQVITDLRAAVYRYNHDWGYVDTVFAVADRYRTAAGIIAGG
jgi:hypothetical protein